MKFLILLYSSYLIINAPLFFALSLPSVKLPNGRIQPRQESPQVGKESRGEYIFLLSNTEKRPWRDIFVEMGLNGSHSLVPTKSQRGYGVDYGSDIHTFGENMRNAKIKNLTKQESDRIAALPFIFAVQATAKISIPTPPNRIGARENLALNETLPTRLLSETLANIGRKVDKTSGNSSKQNDSLVEIMRNSWNLERISSLNPVNHSNRNVEDLSYTYRYMSTGSQDSAGFGVDAYVLDTGLATNISTLNGRAKAIMVDLGDDAGHGTMCASLLGGTYYGVSGGANIFGIKVVGDGAVSIEDAMDQVITLHKQRLTDPHYKGSVISMSIGIVGVGDNTNMKAEVVAPTIFQMAKLVIAAGIHLVVSAGNDKRNACVQAPVGFSQTIPLIGVGASDIDDSRDPHSNYGPCVDIYAPGVTIPYQNRFGNIETGSGTSSATPLVAGVVAYELGRSSEFKLDPAGMKKYILSKALKGVITQDPNILLLYNGVDAIDKAAADIS
ncbi:Cerevisin [Arthrobotrys entomopaga]|nr:Cerevisin [Arthrobotrys entomopaga]